MISDESQGPVGEKIRKAKRTLTPKESASERIPLEIVSFTESAQTEPPKTATLLGLHWLFRAGWCLLIGPTGQGKTSILIQAGALWVLGLLAFGIKPNGPLRIMLVQVENDQADIHEMTSGILTEINATEEQRKRLGENFIIVAPRTPTPELFAPGGEIAEKIAEWKPDLVLLDSLYKWTPRGNATDSEGIFQTIDKTLLPLAKQCNFGVLASHHMGRAEVLRIAESKNGDLSDLYAGAGGMFVADNARGTLLLVPEGTEPGRYVLRGARRKSRLGWLDKNGAKIYERHLEWAEGRIGWREVDEATAAKRQAEGERKKRRGEITKQFEQVRWALGQAGGSGGEWVERSKVVGVAQSPEGPLPKGIKDRAFRELLKQMTAEIEEAIWTNEHNRKASFIRFRVAHRV